MEDSLEAAGLWPIKEYIRRRQATISGYIANHPTYEICTGVERIPGSGSFLQCWGRYITWEEYRNVAREGEEREVV